MTHLHLVQSVGGEKFVDGIALKKEKNIVA
jgi:hypothetical protein